MWKFLSTLFSSGRNSTDLYPDNFEAISKKVESKGTESLEENELLIYVIWSFEAELNNGGFHQYFFNSAGDFAVEAHSSLQKIGAVGMAELLNSAIQIAFNGETPKNRIERQSLLELDEEEKEEALGELGSNFYSSDENIAELVNMYLANRVL